MLPWFLKDSARLKSERAAIADLLRSSGWLIGVDWQLSPELSANVVVRAHGHDYELRLSYPNLFPEVPAVVRPINAKSRLTTHQYGGADGPLCLEWGPDNWHSGVTGAKVLESVYKLLEIENPLGGNQPAIPVVAPSRHELAVGQEIRGKLVRWFVGDDLQGFMKEQPLGAVGSFKFSFSKRANAWTCLVHEATPLQGEAWRDSKIPSELPGALPASWHEGAYFKTDLHPDKLKGLSTHDSLNAVLGEHGAKFLAMDGSSPITGLKGTFTGALVSDGEGELHFYLLYDGGFIECAKVKSEKAGSVIRTPERNFLSERKIGIVGLGSAGSQIAEALTRMGVTKFYLIDHDILFPENLERHALDWLGVTQHKVNAMKAFLERINPGVQVEVSDLHLTGQESSALVSGGLEKLSGCDLLIDATAEPRVFNLVAACALGAKRPMIWMEIYGGGLGGLVARSRPEADPTPQQMRQVFLNYCKQNPYEQKEETVDRYAVENSEGEVLSASMADVAIIAHHATRFVPDCFRPKEESIFPFSMYLLGLRKGWVFQQPFDTIPFQLEQPSAAAWTEPEDRAFDEEERDFILGLLKADDATPPAT
ncbi:MAG: dinucleotide-utilizing enzyme involved in molybdopterin or thiamine biosynthesis [Verrucomicrobiales bacterium]|nr:dinucleotide-utilizing enzyme involved in molybdopterin or thiamine biosynthesis [Verrucomicrobiales bacterium]